MSDWLLPMLDPEVCGGGLAVNRSQLTPLLVLEQLGKRSRTCCVYCYLTAAHKAQPS